MNEEQAETETCKCAAHSSAECACGAWDRADQRHVLREIAREREAMPDAVDVCAALDRVARRVSELPATVSDQREVRVAVNAALERVAVEIENKLLKANNITTGYWTGARDAAAIVRAEIKGVEG